MAETCGMGECKAEATGAITIDVCGKKLRLPRCTFHLYQQRAAFAKALGIKPEQVATRA